jgi:metallo-beta-lactamase family protein
MTIELQFLGAAGCVTGSQFLVTSGERRLLVDCGMFQGSPDEIERNRLPFAFDADGLDSVLLTHAHLDHCGRLPALVRAGFHGPIHATSATVALADVVLRDSAKLQVEAAKRWRRKHRHEAAESEALAVDDPELPARLRAAPREGRTMTRDALYTEADVEQTMRQARGTAYDTEVAIADGVSAIFHDAGHILGSAIIELRLQDREQAARGDLSQQDSAGSAQPGRRPLAKTGRSTTVVFSGDIGRSNTAIIRDPTPLSDADYVVVESTYGNREHGDYEVAVDELVRTINEVSSDGGVLLVPAFAIGHTQEFVWVLDELVRQGRITRLPLYIDSPMASRATRIYHEHPDLYDEETRQLIASGDSPLEYPGQQFTDTRGQSKAIRNADRPFMVVASSGMLTGGRVMHHLKDILPDPSSTLLFIGYQGEGTLGRHLQDGAMSARIDGEEYPVRCRVRSISGFSAHADQSELEAWLANFARSSSGGGGRPKTVFIVHGDPDAAEAFASRIRGQLGMDAHVARYLERVSLTATGS